MKMKMPKPMDESYKLFIDGKWVNGKERKTFKSFCPSNGELLAICAEAGKEDVDKAVKAAWKAFDSWKDVSPQERSGLLLKIADLIDANKEKLAMVETLDNGKPIRETMNVDVPLASDHFRYFAGVIRAEEGQAVMIDKDTLSIILREPIGVVGQIIPWNFPLLMAAWKIAPALATGNTVVLKPAEFTPLTALAFAELCQEAGLPAGVVNIVTGDGSTGEALVKHPDVDKIAFTGSTEVGRAIRSATAASHKRLSLELGGKSPFIIFDDADLDSAVEGLVDGIWFNQGQVCCAGSRLLMQESIAETLIAKIRDRMATLRIGPPL